MIEVIILGTGAAIPVRGQTNSSYLVRSGEVGLLIDCGPAILQQLDQVDLTPDVVTHIFITHRHGDHTLGYPLFRLWWAIRGPDKGPLPTTIASSVTWASLDELEKHTYGDTLATLGSAPRITLSATEPGSWELNEHITLRTWPMAHGDFAPVLGVRVDAGDLAIAFTGDTTACENLVPLARDADLLVHDATFSATLTPEYANGAHGHCTAQMAGRHAAQANVKHLVLTHIAPEYAGRHDVLIEEAEREFNGLISLPSAGEVYSL
jgi:ribonuclease Z